MRESPDGCGAASASHRAEQPNKVHRRHFAELGSTFEAVAIDHQPVRGEPLGRRQLDHSSAIIRGERHQSVGRGGAGARLRSNSSPRAGVERKSEGAQMVSRSGSCIADESGPPPARSSRPSNSRKFAAAGSAEKAFMVKSLRAASPSSRRCSDRRAPPVRRTSRRKVSLRGAPPITAVTVPCRARRNRLDSCFPRADASPRPRQPIRQSTRSREAAQRVADAAAYIAGAPSAASSASSICFIPWSLHGAS